MLSRFNLSYIQVVGKSIRHYAPRKITAGIGRQVNQLDMTYENFQEDPEGFGDLESDFMNVHKSHKQHEQEEQRYREKLRQWTIKNKYFRVKYPNFLTYAEKEQIKLLNTRDPEEWTSEKLSESFPANSETIEKIIKAKWVPRSAQRVHRHDQSVMKNWSLFKKGQFPELKTDLKNHIDQFARSRKDLTNLKRNESIQKPALPSPKIKEFSNIITGSRKLSEQKKENLLAPTSETLNSEREIDMRHNKLKQLPLQSHSDNETYLTSKVNSKTQMRMQDLAQFKLKNKLSLPENETSDFQAYQQLKNPTGTGIISISKYNSNEVNEIDMKFYNVSPIKEQIHIPKRLWKKGATFKVQDCYYDDDGEFLYRVPGMAGNGNK